MFEAAVPTYDAARLLDLADDGKGVILHHAACGASDYLPPIALREVASGFHLMTVRDILWGCTRCESGGPVTAEVAA